MMDYSGESFLFVQRKSPKDLKMNPTQPEVWKRSNPAIEQGRLWACSRSLQQLD